MAGKTKDTTKPQHDYNDAHYGTLPWISFPSGGDITGMGFMIDNGVSPITTGVKADIPVLFNCNITSVMMYGNLSGNVIIDVQKGTHSGFPTTSSIAGSNKPTLLNQIKYLDTTLTSWSNGLNDGDVLRFIVNSGSTVTRLSFILKLQKI